MTATALTTAAPTVPGAAGAGASGKPNPNAKPTGVLAGFEAIVAALFPQADPTAAPAAGLQPGLKAADGDPLAGDKAKDGATDEAAATLPATDAAVCDPNAALAASLAATPAAATEAAPATAPAETAKGPRLQGAIRPGAPLINLAGPAGTDSGKTELSPETAGAMQTAEPAPAASRRANLTPKTDTPPPAWGRDKAPGAPAAPALANAAAKVDLAKSDDLPVAPAPASDAAPADAAAPATAAAAVAAAALAHEPAPAPAPAAKPAKAERGKVVSETAAVSDPKAPLGAAKAAISNPVTAAARPTAAEGDAADAATTSGKAASEHDQPEGTPSAETHAAAQTAAPQTHTSHAVRGSPETVANLAAQIIKKLEGKSTRFDVELDPAGLGKVNVRIDIGAQGAISAAMSFDNPQAASELRARAAELQRHLEQAGFNLTGGVTFDVAQDRGQQGQAWQGAGQDDNNTGRAFRGQAFQAALDTAGDATDAALGGALRLRRGLAAGVDMRI